MDAGEFNVRNKTKTDTDQLSKEAYEGVIIAAERFHHELTVEFGVLSYESANESEYLKNAIELIKELKEIEN